ncbi:MAG TPA: hypothetical protein VHN14_13545 [Kofleriaceae bacterium]|nr:hypothetical protein [Kofleriaceae bacterium]
MGYRLVLLLLVVVSFGACGKEIGDACVVASDCSPNGDRQCDPDSSSPGGYCTIYGCDYSTCPGEATCVRFFTGSFENPLQEVQPNPPVDPPLRKVCGLVEDNETYVCSLDEQCALTGHCVLRSSEIRYCMRTCESDGDCRDGYECRDLEKMKEHGGEPLLAPGVPFDAHAPKFCAVKPASS